MQEPLRLARWVESGEGGGGGWHQANRQRDRRMLLVIIAEQTHPLPHN